MLNNLSLQKIAYLTIIVIGLGWLLHIGAGLLLPLIYAMLLSTFLYPLNKRIHGKIKLKWLSILMTFVVAIVPLALIVSVFTWQLSNIVESMPEITNNLKSAANTTIESIQRVFPFLRVDLDNMLSEKNMGALSGPINLLSKGVLSTTSIVVSSGLCIIYTFFMLYYRESLRKLLVYQFERNARADVRDTLFEVKQTIQSYIGGLGLVMLILAALTTLGLWIIGVKYAFFWGALAGVLAIIPFIGPLLGGILPFLYTLSTYEYSWQPIAVVFVYVVIQQLEGLFITPKIVGDKVDINPLIAIIGLLFFSAFWGIGGIILSLPLISIARIIFDKFEKTTPIAVLMSSDIKSNLSNISPESKNSK